MSHRRPTLFCSVVVIAAATFALSTGASGAPLDVPLGFSTLPSAQGFTYTPSGSHAGVLESTVFSVAGGVLTQNSMGQSNGVSGGGILYVRTGGANAYGEMTE